MSTVLHPVSQKRFDSYVADPPHAILLVAPIGSGKGAILHELAASILGPHSAGRLFEIVPEPDKSSIGIEAIRDLKTNIKLASDKNRIILIPDAQQMTPEAQNSLLKILEEPPKNVVFLLSSTGKDQLLDTVVSRTNVWQLRLPTNEQLLSHFSKSDPVKLQRALAIANGRAGLVQALLDESDSQHPLLAGIETSKELLQESKFDRLCRVEALSKDQPGLKVLFEALELTVTAALEHAAKTNNQRALAEWHRKLKEIIAARKYLSQSVQVKLLLSNLFVRL